MTEQVEIGPYQVQSKLGYGGMAVVYHAVDGRQEAGSPTRDVALKILLPQYYNDDAFLRRFAKEGLNARRLNHPNIVKTYAAGQDDGYHYIAMQFIDGCTLEQYVLGKKSLSVAETVAALSPIADALDYAHELGYIHRDLKLNNIMRSNSGRYLLTDFGVSKHLSTDLSMMTGMGQSIGTPSYMSPEQARGEQITDGKSDIYSLGVIAYRLMTGHLPFVAEDVFELTHKIIVNQPIDPQRLNPAIDAAAANALTQALAKDPAARPATCRNFINAIAGIVEEEPVGWFGSMLNRLITLIQQQVRHSAKVTNSLEKQVIRHPAPPIPAPPPPALAQPVVQPSAEQRVVQTSLAQPVVQPATQPRTEQPVSTPALLPVAEASHRRPEPEPPTNRPVQRYNPNHVHAEREPVHDDLTQPGVVAMPIEYVANSVTHQAKFIPGEPLPGQPPRPRQKRTTTVLTSRIKPKSNPNRHIEASASARNGQPSDHRLDVPHNSDFPAAQHQSTENWFESSTAPGAREFRPEKISKQIATDLYQIVEPLVRGVRNGIPFKRN